MHDKLRAVASLPSQVISRLLGPSNYGVIRACAENPIYLLFLFLFCVDFTPLARVNGSTLWSVRALRSRFGLNGKNGVRNIGIGVTDEGAIGDVR